ncbi:MAG: hypothetical protein SGI74_04795 [Oligoflexia bacterium]|nr:hypothetical protein [Oligoflexia bacterium]
MPSAVSTNGTQLLVVERDNHRALLWNSIPTVTKQPADVVLGQPDFTTATAGITQSKLSSPIGGYIDKNRIYIVDFGNRRVLIWNSIPTTNGAPADIVLGQPNFTTNIAGATATGMNAPQGFSSNSLLQGIKLPSGY